VLILKIEFVFHSYIFEIRIKNMNIEQKSQH